MNNPTESLQMLVKGVLTEVPMTAQEIADKTGGSHKVVRLAVAALEDRGYAISIGSNPTRYRLAKEKKRGVSPAWGI